RSTTRRKTIVPITASSCRSSTARAGPRSRPCRRTRNPMSLSDFTAEGPFKRPRPARRKRRTQAERTQGTRTRILDAAVEVLRKKGYAHFRTADVARAAGVSRGAQLHHFATKEKLVYATMEHVFQNVLETSRKRARALRPGEDPLEQMIAD